MIRKDRTMSRNEEKSAESYHARYGIESRYSCTQKIYQRKKQSQSIAEKGRDSWYVREGTELRCD
jgi:hypothetical protein